MDRAEVKHRAGKTRGKIVLPRRREPRSNTDLGIRNGSINGCFSVRVTTKLRRLAERHKPSSGRKGDHEVVEGARESILIEIAKNP